MKKILFVVGLIVALAGCSSPGPKRQAADAEMGFNMPNGSLTLVIDGDGNFVSAKSVASAQVLSNTLAGKEAAVTVASSRAKRTLAEFMNNEITSSNVVDQVANATNTDNTYAQEVTEKINANSQALLRGAYISKQTLEGDTVFVEVTITNMSIRGSESMRMQISGVR